MAQTNLIVMGVVGGSHLEAACSEVHLDIAVFDDGNLPADQRDKHLLSLEPMITFIGGVDADRRVGHNRLRTSRGYDQILVGRITVTV